MVWLSLIPIACVLSGPVTACETALLLAVDVSGSISPQEYTLQINGLADALGDPVVVSALVSGQDSLAMVQWSGSGYQLLAMPWQSPDNAAAVARLADKVRGTERPGFYTDTAIGEAIQAALAALEAAPHCNRRVIDVSGDGKQNDGSSLADARDLATSLGVTINGVAIEIGDNTLALTDYYQHNVATADGFVITAKGVKDFPRAIHDKLLRELTKPVS